VTVRDGGGFVVQDTVDGAGGRRLTWHWLLADELWELEPGKGERQGCRSPLGTIRWHGVGGTRARLVRADPASAFGWRSRHYAAVEPAVSLLIEADAPGDVELVTEFVPR